jgi:cytochrome P450
MVAATALTNLETARPVPRVPGGLPWVGHLPEMQRDFLGLIVRARDEVGDMAMIQAGPKKVICISDPAAAQYVLVDNPKNYSKQTRGYDNLRKMLGNGLVTSEGSFWLRQRRISQPAFHREKIGALAAVISRDADEAIASWDARIASGEPFDFSSDMMKLTMRIIGEMLFSVDVSGDSDEAGGAINEMVHQAVQRTVSLINFPMGMPTPKNLRFTKAKRTLDELIYGAIRERRAGVAKPDMLSMLMETVDEETGETMSDEQLRDELLTLFAAGHETTSMALSWTLHALLDNPDVEEKLRAEIANARSIEQIVRAPYLDAVLKESFRLYPPVWMVARCAESDDVIPSADGTWRVHEGEMVFISQWTIHRHPKLWREPLRFDPSRFLEETDGARHKYAYFPFLGGPRKCIGDQLAILEAKIILTKALQRARFARVPGHEVIPDPTVTLRMLNGLKVTARPA